MQLRTAKLSRHARLYAIADGPITVFNSRS